MANPKHPLSNSNEAWAETIGAAVRNSQAQPHNITEYERAQLAEAERAAREAGGLATRKGRK